jgi:hypothetical protein
MQTVRQLASRVAAASLDPLSLLRNCAGSEEWMAQARRMLEVSPGIRYLSCCQPCGCDPEVATRVATRAALQRIPKWGNNAAKVEVTRLESGALAPWTPTSQLPKRNVYPKRMRHMLSVLDKEYKQNLHRLRKPDSFPRFMSGDVITVNLVRFTPMILVL